MRTRVIVWAAVLVVLVVIFGTCYYGRPAEAAELVTDTVPSPETFTTRAGLTTTADGATASCWRWSMTRAVKNAWGEVQYSFRETLEWCGNAARTKVTKLRSNICQRVSGFFDYLGCTRAHGSAGSFSMYTTDQWHFQGGCCGIFINRYPHIDAWVKATGVITGTVYYR